MDSSLGSSGYQLSDLRHVSTSSSKFLSPFITKMIEIGSRNTKKTIAKKFYVRKSMCWDREEVRCSLAGFDYHRFYLASLRGQGTI